MEIVLEDFTMEEQRYIVSFLWTKELNVKDVHKEMFPVYGWKCLSRKAINSWIEKHGNRFADDVKFETEFLKWLRTVRILHYCGFRRNGKAMGQVYQCWWRICQEIIFFPPRFEYHTLYIHL
jgi:hypothetical protein